MNVEVNSNGVNKLIKYNILSDEEMRDIGFTDYAEDTWYFCRMIKLLKTSCFQRFAIFSSCTASAAIVTINCFKFCSFEICSSLDKISIKASF